MIQVFQEIFEKALARLSLHVTTYMPPLLVAVTILAGAFLLATVVRWLILKAVKGAALERFLSESGLSSMLYRSGRLRAASLVAGVAYWTIVAVGVLTALDVFDTNLTSRIIEATVFSIPKLVTAGAILLAGFWLAQYLGRSTLVWAVNEGMPMARRLAIAVRIVVMFVAVVVAADALDFAERVFLAAFVILVGSAALAASLAVGFSLRDSLKRYLSPDREQATPEHERSLWSHL
jgi:hypothetical protein